MAIQTKAVSINIANLSSAIKQITKQQEAVSVKPTVRSTVFSLGSDPRVASLQLTTPDFFMIELMKDALKQLFVRAHWRIPRFDIDSGKVSGFNIYRKKTKVFFDEKLSNNQFSKLTRNLKRNGKFSEDKKGIYSVKRGLIGLSVLNSRLDEMQNSLDSENLSAIEKSERRDIFFRQENAIKKFEKIAFVEFSKFITQQKEKQVFVEDVSNVSMFYDDKAVGFGEEFEYYVSAVSVNFEETYQSDIIKVLIQDNNNISEAGVSAKQVDETKILIKATYKKEDQIDNVFIFRKELDDDIEFLPVAEFLDVIGESVEFPDNRTKIGRTYTYRVFLQNIHGVVSSPTEITTFSSIGTEKSRSNNLKKPIFHADQQKNVATISFSPNDPKVMFYVIDRRDVSIYEKSFIVPRRETNKYGGRGWTSNQLFYDRNKMNKIVFIDDTVQPDHIYQYRVVGMDRFGNKTSYTYQNIEIVKGSGLKPPQDIQVTILREFPLRVKFKWIDSNVYDKDSIPEYEVQRRMGHESFQWFPLTPNNYVLDEVVCDDPLDFLIFKQEDIFTSAIPNRSRINQRGTVPRGNGVLDFLKENFIYSYRIRILTSDGLSSGFSDEVRITTALTLSKPVNLTAINQNSKIRPAIIQLTWETRSDQFQPDHFVIERRVDNINDSFIPVGKSYLGNVFFDRNVKAGRNYIYRVKSVDAIGRETEFVEVRIGV